MVRGHLRKNYNQKLEPLMSQEFIVHEAKSFFQTLEILRLELVARDAAYAVAKKSKQRTDMQHYHHLAQEVSYKCLNYGRELCDAPIPQWVDGVLSQDNGVVTRHAYDVIRNKICASLSVFENDLLPNAKVLIDFAEGRH
jgi:hypothetical protein